MDVQISQCVKSGCAYTHAHRLVVIHSHWIAGENFQPFRLDLIFIYLVNLITT